MNAKGHGREIQAKMKNTSMITQTADRPGSLMDIARDFLFSGAGSNLGGTGLNHGSVG